MKGTNFSDSTLIGAIFRDADLSYTNTERLNIKDLITDGADLRGTSIM